MKKTFLWILLSVFLFVGIKGNAYGFGLVNKGNTRPNAGKYDTILKENGGIYLGPDTQDIYLTFDCGYENGHTKMILEALRKTDTKAIFFITGHYLNSATDLVMEMIEDGHIIGNHTYSHKDFTKSSNEEILKDIEKLEDAFKEKTGYEMSKYVRPPRGEFDERSLKLLKDNGYASIFWSLAYVDWHQDAFHGDHYSYNQVMKRIHNGAILLMHTVSKDNAVDLEDIILKLKNDGYVFKTIDSVI
ncbi:MAG: polysaccharide deacetylase family protein [Anaeroplasmataceae bacterium]|nr:polysaccharide deacetylase family protein [Anaeroplasmataceae bacterium]MDE6241038.1 polysaccharide deacetylase family protein [Anaeroplasmataceae bacterium]